MVKSSDVMREHRDVEAAVAEMLEKQKLRFKHEPLVGGVRPDFLVEHQDGRVTIIEAKGWPATRDAVKRAAEQGTRYRAATGADRVLMVLPHAPKTGRESGVVGMSELEAVLQAPFGPVLQVRSGVKRGARKKTAARGEQLIFAAMPFDGAYDDTFFVMAEAAKAVDAACVRVDQEEFVGNIPERIRKDIKRSRAVIADLSEAKPNVLYEAGFAHALNIQTIHICSTPLKDLPFDLGWDNTISYSKGQTYRLKEKLVRRLGAIL